MKEEEKVEQKEQEFIEIDTPGKIRTLALIKYFIFGLVTLLVLYGFLFDKWELPPLQDPE